jgi:hypothetical protein
MLLIIIILEIKNNKELVLASLKSSSADYQYIGDEFKNDKVLFKSVDMYNNFKYAGQDVRSDLEIIKTLYEKTILIRKFFHIFLVHMKF